MVVKLKWIIRLNSLHDGSFFLNFLNIHSIDVVDRLDSIKLVILNTETFLDLTECSRTYATLDDELFLELPTWSLHFGVFVWFIVKNENGSGFIIIWEKW